MCKHIHIDMLFVRINNLYIHMICLNVSLSLKGTKCLTLFIVRGYDVAFMYVK